MDMNGEHPPRGLVATLKQLGPGLIVSGSIVGSGELIATTTLGARVGFTALWLIILSCVIKVVVQQELGRYTITSGETTFGALHKIPGPRWRTSWVVWCWMFMFVAVTVQQGGILGGVGQVFNLAFPQLSGDVWTVIMAATILVLLFGGGYLYIERASTFMVVSFTFITLACAILLAWTPYRIELRDLVDGLKFNLPEGGISVAFAVFGITGVGATELIYYPYWCLEKGYARFVGRNVGSEAWLERAHAWVRIMHMDTLVAMMIYTLATVAFYALGSRVLYGMGKIPEGYDMVQTLSNMYTTTLGPGAFYLFLLGAFFVLYSTTFSAMASNSRVLVNFFELVRGTRIEDETRRSYLHRVAVVAMLLIAITWYLMVGQPVFMVIIGGIAQACMLPIISFSTIYLRYRHTHSGVRPGWFSDVLLWSCSTLMLGFAGYTLISRLSG